MKKMKETTPIITPTNVNGKQEIIFTKKPDLPKTFRKKKKVVKSSKGTIFSIMPKNLKEQEEIFFQSNCSVAPIFEYENPYLA